MKLNEERIAERLAAAAGWKREDAKWIVKKYRFRTFTDSVSFVGEIAELAERMNHHPFIAIDYKLVTLKLSSWHAGGLTDLDFMSAAAYDRAYADFQAAHTE